MSKTIVITGAGVGLGRTLARGFASKGNHVVLLGRTFSKVEAAANEIGELAMAVECDIGSADSVKQAFAKIAERHSTIDVLINNAAIFEPFKLEDGTDKQIFSAINTNFTGTVLCSRSAIPLFGDNGQIINVSSESVELPLGLLTIYQGTKAGVEGFSKMLSLELEPQGIKVSVVRCGAMYEEGKAWEIDPEAAKAFHMENVARGIDMTKRPITHFGSMESIFQMLVDLPADVKIGLLTAEARTPR